MAVLITGGAGYIGSHTAKLLSEAKRELVVLDNLSTGNEWAVPKSAKFLKGDVGSPELVEDIIKKESIDAVIHFAASIEVAESVDYPEKYFANNTFNTFKLLETCLRNKVSRFIFSSTAATYGQPDVSPIPETAPQNPINPYGSSKLMMERLIKDMSQGRMGKDCDFKYVILRYFNVAGATKDLSIGQAYPNSTHLIKIAAEVVAGKRDKMAIFGTDYPTADGTCVRDYIHVDDLASAHKAALEYLENNGASDVFNCGYGKGYSVKEVIQAAKKVSQMDFEVNEEGRRAGDPAELVSDSQKIQSHLSWTPEFDDLELICQSAIEWEKKLTAST